MRKVEPLAPFETIRSREIEEDRTDRVPDSDLHRTPVSGFGVEVHVERRRRPAEESLEGAEPGTELAGRVRRGAALLGPDACEEALQLHALGDAPEESHR